MLNRDKSGLIIFDNFQIDFNLPKWRLREQKSTNPESGSMPSFIRFNRSRDGLATDGGRFMPLPTGAAFVVGGVSGASSDSRKEPSFFQKIFQRGKLKRLEEERRRTTDVANQPNFTVEEVAEPKDEISAEEFFIGIKGGAEEINLATERYKNYESAIAHLKNTGQTAMLEMMEHDFEIHAAETRLYALGFRKVVTEANVIEFSKKSCRGIALDWIKNFARVIPQKVVEVKLKADENKIFDNYIIMHYDPMKNGRMMTIAEREKEEGKDPILFGVIAGSNKLYYLADWIDEYCNLTFDKLVEKLGADAINANELSVNVPQIIHN